MQNHELVFICGLHRSGTSVLFQAIREHPQISGFENTESPEDEGMHLQTVYKPSGAYGGAGKFGFHAEAHLTEASPLVTEANRQKLFSEWRPHWDLNNHFLLEKSPPNLIRTRFLQAMFPQSSFIIFLRHPVAVSLATRRWYRTARIYSIRLHKVFEHWVICHEIFEKDRHHLQKYLVLKYEDFVHDPPGELEKVYKFLGLENNSPELSVHSGINEKYLSQWKAVLSGRISRLGARRIVNEFEPRVKSFGYSLIDLEKVNSVVW
jgi:hypothetical protein